MLDWAVLCLEEPAPAEARAGAAGATWDEAFGLKYGEEVAAVADAVRDDLFRVAGISNDHYPGVEGKVDRGVLSNVSVRVECQCRDGVEMERFTRPKTRARQLLADLPPSHRCLRNVPEPGGKVEDDGPAGSCSTVN